VFLLTPGGSHTLCEKVADLVQARIELVCKFVLSYFKELAAKSFEPGEPFANFLSLMKAFREASVLLSEPVFPDGVAILKDFAWLEQVLESSQVLREVELEKIEVWCVVGGSFFGH
jgi:hypothetical protein